MPGNGWFLEGQKSGKIRLETYQYSLNCKKSMKGDRDEIIAGILIINLNLSIFKTYFVNQHLIYKMITQQT
jgi:hypothetical protein